MVKTANWRNFATKHVKNSELMRIRQVLKNSDIRLAQLLIEVVISQLKPDLSWGGDTFLYSNTVLANLNETVARCLNSARSTLHQLEPYSYHVDFRQP